MKRMRIAVLTTVIASIVVSVPAFAIAGCLTKSVGLAEQPVTPAGTQGPRPQGGPISEPRTYQPVNGTGGFSVFGASTLAKGDFSVGVGYMGENAVCQDTNGDFDFNTLFIPLAYGITDRLQVGIDLPYTWYEADKAGYSGQGPDDVNLGLVYRILDEEGWRPALGIVGFVAAPTGMRHQGTGRNSWDVGGKVALTKALPGNLLGHASLGYTYIGDGASPQDSIFTSGVALEYQINQYVSLVAEGLADTNNRTGVDRHSEWVSEGRAGLRLRYGHFLLSLAGRKGFTNDAPDWGMFALLTYTGTAPWAGGGGPAAGGAAAAGPAGGG